MSARNQVVARLAEIPAGTAREFEVGGGDWPYRGFVVHWQGEVYAYQNTCPHAGHPLNLDPDRFFATDGAHLICRSHGALFAPGSGVCVAGPCAGASLRALACWVSAGDVWVTAPAEPVS